MRVKEDGFKASDYGIPDSLMNIYTKMAKCMHSGIQL
ncbi:hypothetical protein ERICI_00567 [Paenibacillus larvae subsp. larvae]|uniref:Uncharacterized protein n=2 Tax=Paenibacillus larvae subsp. larvae TaxID=147375 RepID=V9W363_9BACL|nr:hypothetical protein ERIC2_c07531 [Paenibacillus larvae subsp. larvae DSM 25430]AVF20500.1 hypothetical protein ERICI_00567 [Paenibacillus larvae subsp. larvae]ETK28544.1 hypothetical protein ERIC1_1c20130 [Paenibacillus larvae subsp. larvae DSM 25719]AVF28247.1 hypothetical protein ERICIII_04181 [Paenibacillus larvae subsp. larvae]AVF32750.1 hypothetical protein ERICIV_03924 [Paenibacillus larvae subsp. larvae]